MKLLFNWISESNERLDHQEGRIQGQVISSNALLLEHPMFKLMSLDNDPGLILAERDGMIRGELVFPLDILSADDMMRFGNMYLASLTLLAADSNEPVVYAFLESEQKSCDAKSFQP